MTAPSNYPTPIVYGPDFPQFKMLMRYGRQVFESRTNQNLFLHPDWGDFNDSGTFTMARFLRKHASWQDCAPLLFDLVAVEEDNFDWIDVLAEPNWEACPACSDLIAYCNNSPAQRSFLASWWRTQYAGGEPNARRCKTPIA